VQTTPRWNHGTAKGKGKSLGWNKNKIYSQKLDVREENKEKEGRLV